MSVPHLPQGDNPVQTYIPVARIADMLLNPGAAYEYNGQHLVYPDIRLVYWCGGNPFHHHQDLARLRGVRAPGDHWRARCSGRPPRVMPTSCCPRP